jgi:hypothetical protein
MRAAGAPLPSRAMDIDAREVVRVDDDDDDDDDRRRGERRDKRLNTFVAITVALMATFMGICKVKDDNLVQAMQQAQADKLDHWSFYQARNLRQDVAEATALQLRLARPGRSASDAAAYDSAIAQVEAKAATEARKKQELLAQAQEDQRTYDRLNYRDDQFDLSDALLAIAIALLAVTALTGFWWLYWLTFVPMGFGMLMGLAGLFAWPIHPEALTRLLS